MNIDGAQRGDRGRDGLAAWRSGADVRVTNQWREAMEKSRGFSNTSGPKQPKPPATSRMISLITRHLARAETIQDRTCTLQI